MSDFGPLYGEPRLDLPELLHKIALEKIPWPESDPNRLRFSANQLSTSVSSSIAKA